MALQPPKKHHDPLCYGGDLLKTRSGRRHGRPISVQRSMHLVLRSTRATGEKDFRRPPHKASIQKILKKFCRRYEVKVLRLATSGNHLHLHIKLGHRAGYKPFIRAITAAIAMAVAGTNRWNPAKEKFWDRRPYTRLVIGLAAMLRLDRYIVMNQYEALGYSRAEAHLAVAADIDLGRFVYNSG